mgnify:CR=1 FL=1
MTTDTVTHLDLDGAQAQALSDALASYLREMHHEIAATDSPRFREELKLRKTALESIQRALTSS